MNKEFIQQQMCIHIARMYKYVKGDYSISASDLQTPNCRTVGYRIINYVEYMNQIDPNYALYSYTYSTGTK